jgi:hypothetical protein
MRFSMPSLFNRLARLKTPAHPYAGGSANLNALNQRFPDRLTASALSPT